MSQSRDIPLAGRLAAMSGLGYSLILVLMVVLGGANTSEYSHISQFISELGARGAQYEWAVRLLGFMPAGLLLLGFCWFAHRALPSSLGTTLGLIGLALYAAGYIVAAAFPCDLGCRPMQPSTSQLIHNLGGFIGYLLAPGVLLLLALSARGWKAAKHLVLSGQIAATLALFGMLTLTPSSATVGLSQRLLETAVLAWVTMCSVYLSQHDPNVTA